MTKILILIPEVEGGVEVEVVEQGVVGGLDKPKSAALEGRGGDLLAC